MKTIKESILNSTNSGKSKIVKNILKKIYKKAGGYSKPTVEHKYDVLNNEIFEGDVVLYTGRSEITNSLPVPFYVESLTPTNDVIYCILCWNPVDDKLYDIYCEDVVKIFDIEKYVK
jgi:hypothetical protein